MKYGRCPNTENYCLPNKKEKNMKKIAIFASGNGSNFQQICEFLKTKDDVVAKLLIVNKKNAYVLQRAKLLGVESHYFNREQFYNTDEVTQLLVEKGIDLVVLAGFLWLVPDNIIKAYPNRIINIHPALLPKYGGKGMYGHNVHHAVVNNKEKESGITIHYVNEQYDSGDIIFQAKCEVLPKDTAEDVASKIHLLEKEFFPTVVYNIAKSLE